MLRWNAAPANRAAIGSHSCPANIDLLKGPDTGIECSMNVGARVSLLRSRARAADYCWGSRGSISTESVRVSRKQPWTPHDQAPTPRKGCPRLGDLEFEACSLQHRVGSELGIRLQPW